MRNYTMLYWLMWTQSSRCHHSTQVVFYGRESRHMRQKETPLRTVSDASGGHPRSVAWESFESAQRYRWN